MNTPLLTIRPAIATRSPFCTSMRVERFSIRNGLFENSDVFPAWLVAVILNDTFASVIGNVPENCASPFPSVVTVLVPRYVCTRPDQVERIRKVLERELYVSRRIQCAGDGDCATRNRGAGYDGKIL